MQIDKSVSPIDGYAIQRYVARRREEARSCRVALQNADFETLGNVAHKILGNYATFGFVELEDIASQLQKAARKRDQAAAVVAIHQLESWADLNVSISSTTH